MPMPALPDDLQARLAAAGVTDAANLDAAFAADPALKADLQQHIGAAQQEMFADGVERFAAVQSDDELLALVAEEPWMLAARFSELVEEHIATDPDSAEALQERLTTLAQIRAMAQLQEMLADGVERFGAVRSSDELLALVAEDPWMMAAEFTTLVEERIAADPDNAEALQERLAILGNMREVLKRFAGLQSEAEVAALCAELSLVLSDSFVSLVEHQIVMLREDEQPAPDNLHKLQARLADLRQLKRGFEDVAAHPVHRALAAFFQAPDVIAARAVFAAHPALMDRAALKTLGALHSDDPEMQQRITERLALLRALQTEAGPQPPRTITVVPSPQPSPTKLIQIGGDQYNQSAVAEYGSVAIVINNTNIHEVQWQRRWVRPTAPLEQRPPIMRPTHVDGVTTKLRHSGRAAITAQNPVAVQGMPGVGKTVLARLLSRHLDADYPGGIIWETLGPDATRDGCGAILNRWASYAFEVQQRQHYQFEPAAVRTLLGGHGPLLVVLDDVWSIAVLQPLLDALPDDAHLLITTRSQRVANDLEGEIHHLDLLSDEEARALIALRLQLAAPTAADLLWMEQLAASVGHHAMALDIALGSVRRRQPHEWPSAAAQIADDIRNGTGFGELPLLVDEEQDAKVELALAYSYRALTPTAQGRLRQLGAFAPEAPFSSAIAAELWNCPPAEAQATLNYFAEAALLEAAGNGWRQHAILRAYALALLRTAGEHDEAAAQHAALYTAAIKRAADQQYAYMILPALPQLRHAFAWAIERNLGCALELLSQCAELHATFGLLAEALT